MRAPQSDFDLAKSEREQLQFWKEKKSFEKLQEKRKHSSKNFTFYDGPPFANGLPHYGHILANTLKDTVPRYWTMRSYYVERRFGWDCHGLPVEYEIEKRDQLKGRSDILKMGVANFNEACRASVLNYANEWEKTITRLGRWVSWDNQYRTMDKSFMESVWWVFSELYQKGLVYKDYKVVPYSPRITAVLSNFEANQNYKDTQDPALTVRFPLADQENTFFLAWTTTPWTLISNLALCVGPEIDYVKIKDKNSNHQYILAKARLASVYKLKDLVSKAASDAFEILEEMKGSALQGISYRPLFSYFNNHDNAFQVLVDDYVTTEDGTGIVHLAPAYGEDDFRICKRANIQLVDPLDEEAKFKSEIKDFEGLYVKDADKEIAKKLKENSLLFKHDTIVHSYPFCERTDHPLIYRAIPAWYVAVEKFKEVMIANNKTINWVPSHLRDGRMGKWLENARDWAISRNRFWGTPLPVWICTKDDSHIEVMSSAAKLEQRSGKTISDLHKHFVDDIEIDCSHCNAKMRRISEVFDCWFESGSMPYAQQHYPFENQEQFESHFPADFIAEGLDQTRGWFYTLSVLSAALFKKPAFKNVVVNGIILDENGRKMSKRHRNYTPPDDLLDKYGADSVRLYMLNSSILRGEDLIFSDKGVKDTTRQVILPLWNAYSFLCTYASSDSWNPSAELFEDKVPKFEHELDRWIISRLQTLTQNLHKEMEAYRLYAVVPEVLKFIEDLTNWYIRLSRRRFWGQTSTASDDEDSQDLENLDQRSDLGSNKELSEDQEKAYQCLFYVLLNFLKMFAPFAPFISEKLYRELVSGTTSTQPESIHHCLMPSLHTEAMDTELESRMALVRTITELGRSLRAKYQLKTRQALSEILVISRNAKDREFVEKGKHIILSELNIKSIAFSTEEQKFVKLNLKPNLKTLGKKLAKDLNVLRQELEQLSKDETKLGDFLHQLESSGSITWKEHTLSMDDFLIAREPLDDRPLATSSGISILLNTKLTKELLAEGNARELVNRIQKFRKDCQFMVSDRIKINLRCEDPGLIEAFRFHSDYICGETLAQTLTFAKKSAESSLRFDMQTQIGDVELFIEIEKI